MGMVCFQNVQERPTSACTRLGVAHLQFGRGWLCGLIGGSAGFPWTQRRAGDAGRYTSFLSVIIKVEV